METNKNNQNEPNLRKSLLEQRRAEFCLQNENTALDMKPKTKAPAIKSETHTSDTRAGFGIAVPTATAVNADSRPIQKKARKPYTRKNAVEDVAAAAATGVVVDKAVNSQEFPALDQGNGNLLPPRPPAEPPVDGRSPEESPSPEMTPSHPVHTEAEAAEIVREWAEQSKAAPYPTAFRAYLSRAIAQELLKINENRPQSRPSYIYDLAAEMDGSTWQENGDSFRLDTNGRMRDGQHRCLALLLSESKGLWTQIMVGLSPESFPTMDKAPARTFIETLATCGEVNVRLLAEASKLLWAFVNDRLTPTTLGVENAKSVRKETELQSTIREHHELRGSVAYIKENKARKPLPIPTMIVAHYLFSQIDKGSADEMVQILVTGDYPHKDHPVKTLKDKLVAIAVSDKSPRQGFYLALFIKTWNCWRKNKPLRRLTFGGNDQYPRPI